MAPLELTKGIYWVGVVDWTRRTFHGHTYTTNRGTTYNAYLIMDEKVALVDTVMKEFGPEMLDRIRQIVPPEKIDYIIANHVENDHSGALPELIKYCPKAKVFGSAKCKEGLEKHYHGSWEFNVVKTGDKLNIGKRTLTFIEAPMLHLPDSMFTYVVEDALLMPNDAFGQHYAVSRRFDDEVPECELMDEAAKYYANILWPFSSLITRKIEEIKKMGVPLKMIAPSHGIIWRKDPMKIVNAYLKWAANVTGPKAVIAYETMWGATAEMAKAIAGGISDAGVDVKIYDISGADRTEVANDMLTAKALILGSSTYDNDMLSGIGGFLIFLKGLKPKNRIGAAFGSYGWGGGAVKSIEGVLKDTGIEIAVPGLGVKYTPDEAELARCREYGKKIADKIKSA